IYVPMLMPKGCGYPLWLLEPSNDPHPDYIRDGTQIGDLGYLDEAGGFVYLFNVGKAFNHAVNVGRTPPNFVPLSDIHEPRNQLLRLRIHQNNESFKATSRDKKSIGGDISAEASTQAAYLVLPDGGKHSKYKFPGILEQYAIDHAHEWYKHFNGQGMQIPNGMLYLMTGCNKCRSWTNACYSHTAESGAVSL
ncbi:hypothetical protein ARMSODRAFT_845214, partial [Armillaria solidipes]